jgi:arginyl-tRNA--protein-N-Asp/Glu arginylyltransferase
MNYLDLLPTDVMKLVNREVEKAHIIKRRIERKRNRNMNREQKRIAERKRDIYKNFARLYNKYIEYQQYKEYSNRVDDHYKITQRLYKQIREKYGPMLLHTEECIGGDEPYIIATLCINGKIVNVKFV